MAAPHRRPLLALLVALPLLAACMVPRVGIEDPAPPAGEQVSATVPPPTTAPPLAPTPQPTPAPLPTRLPTPCASGRVAGQVCLSGADVFLHSCCPPYEAKKRSDATGAFAFEALTVGTFTVTCGLYSEVVTLRTCESQVNVDLCPPPTARPGP